MRTLFKNANQYFMKTTGLGVRIITQVSIDPENRSNVVNKYVRKFGNDIRSKDTTLDFEKN